MDGKVCEHKSRQTFKVNSGRPGLSVRWWWSDHDLHLPPPHTSTLQVKKKQHWRVGKKNPYPGNSQLFFYPFYLQAEEVLPLLPPPPSSLLPAPRSIPVAFLDGYQTWSIIPPFVLPHSNWYFMIFTFNKSQSHHLTASSFCCVLSAVLCILAVFLVLFFFRAKSVFSEWKIDWFLFRCLCVCCWMTLQEVTVRCGRLFSLELLWRLFALLLPRLTPL